MPWIIDTLDRIWLSPLSSTPGSVGFLVPAGGDSTLSGEAVVWGGMCAAL